MSEKKQLLSEIDIVFVISYRRLERQADLLLPLCEETHLKVLSVCPSPSFCFLFHALIHESWTRWITVIPFINPLSIWAVYQQPSNSSSVVQGAMSSAVMLIDLQTAWTAKHWFSVQQSQTLMSGLRAWGCSCCNLDMITKESWMPDEIIIINNWLIELILRILIKGQMSGFIDAEWWENITGKC